MEEFTHAKKVDMNFMYDHSSDNTKVVLWMYQEQFPHRQMPDHRIFLGMRKTALYSLPDIKLFEEELYTVQAWKKAFWISYW